MNSQEVYRKHLHLLEVRETLMQKYATAMKANDDAIANLLQGRTATADHMINVCNKCQEECNLFDVDVPLHGDDGRLITSSRRESVSFCCRAGITMKSTASDPDGRRVWRWDPTGHKNTYAVSKHGIYEFSISTASIPIDEIIDLLNAGENV